DASDETNPKAPEDPQARGPEQPNGTGAEPQGEAGAEPRGEAAPEAASEPVTEAPTERLEAADTDASDEPNEEPSRWAPPTEDGSADPVDHASAADAYPPDTSAHPQGSGPHPQAAGGYVPSAGLIELAFEPQGGDRVPGEEADRVLVVDEVRALGSHRRGTAGFHGRDEVTGVFDDVDSVVGQHRLLPLTGVGGHVHGHSEPEGGAEDPDRQSEVARRADHDPVRGGDLPELRTRVRSGILGVE